MSTTPSQTVPAKTDLSEIDHPTYRVNGGSPPPAVDVGELWSYRELLLFLTNRDLKVRYKQTALGAGWAIIQPIIQMGVMTIVLGYVAGLKDKTPGVPYAVLTFTALVPWQLFSSALGNASNSLVGNERLVTKVYFPRLIIPAASVLARVVDFGICAAVLAIMIACYWMMGKIDAPGIAALTIPLFTLWTVVLAFGSGLYLSALNVRWRDVGHMVPFLMQILMWISGVYITSQLIPERYHTLRFIYHLNPIANIVDGFRWGLLHQAPPPLVPALLSAGLTLLLVWFGLRYFRKAEETFADVI